MARIEKNKNFLEFYVGENTTPYKLDMNTGMFYGLRGSVVQKMPNGVPSLIDHCWHNSNVLRYLHNVHYNRGVSYSKAIMHHLDVIKLLDRVDSLNMGVVNWHYYDIERNVDTLNRGFSLLVAYIKEHGIGCNLDDFCNVIALDLFLKEHNLAIDEHFTESMARFLLDYAQEFTKEQIKFIVYFLTRGVWEYHNQDRYAIIAILRRFFQYADYIDWKVEKSDFFRQYINISRTYYLKKEEYDAKVLRMVQEKHKTALQFEDNNFVVVIPTTPQEFITEGERQHNCVGGYVSSVMKEHTNVIFIRQKSALDTPYITCEVKNGRIWQFLTAYNRPIYDTDIVEFRKAYEQHLRANW